MESTVSSARTVVGGITRGVRRKLESPVGQHLKCEFVYHALMGTALAMTPGALIGMLGTGLQGLKIALIAWALCAVPATALLLYEEGLRFAKQQKSS